MRQRKKYVLLLCFALTPRTFKYRLDGNDLGPGGALLVANLLPDLKGLKKLRYVVLRTEVAEMIRKNMVIIVILTLKIVTFFLPAHFISFR